MTIRFLNPFFFLCFPLLSVHSIFLNKGIHKLNIVMPTHNFFRRPSTSSSTWVPTWTNSCYYALRHYHHQQGIHTTTSRITIPMHILLHFILLTMLSSLLHYWYIAFYEKPFIERRKWEGHVHSSISHYDSNKKLSSRLFVTKLYTSLELLGRGHNNYAKKKKKIKETELPKIKLHIKCKKQINQTSVSLYFFCPEYR